MLLNGNTLGARFSAANKRAANFIAQTENTNVKLASGFAVLTRIFVSILDDIFSSKNHLKFTKENSLPHLKIDQLNYL
jgi:hypothetical protein